jgi:hypothetical protein
VSVPTGPAWWSSSRSFSEAWPNQLIQKVFAGRDRDWGDVESVLIRQRVKLDLSLVRKELKPLLELKGQPEAMTKLDTLIGTVNRRLSA